MSSDPPAGPPTGPDPAERPALDASGYLDDLWDDDGYDDDGRDDARRDDDGRRGPNYTARRTLMVAALAVAAGIAALMAYNSMRTTDSALVLEPPLWNAIVEVDRGSGLVTVIDTDGRELDTVSAAGRVTAIETRGSQLALAGPGSLTLVDAARGRSVAVELERGWTTRALTDTDALVLVSAPTTTGPLLLIDGDTGRQIDVARVADQRTPLLLADSIRSDPAGRSFAIGDGRNFQTIVVGFDAIDGIDDDVVFFPGVPLAISDDLVVTSANVGQSAELGLFDRDGSRREAITSDRPIGGVIDGERFVYVTSTGRVLRAERGQPTEISVIPIPGSDDVREVAAVANGQRMLVTGERFTAVVALDGELLHQSNRPAGQVPPTPNYSWRCAPVLNNSVVSIIDLVDGTSVGETRLADAAPADDERSFDAVSADGCAVAIGDRVISATGTTTVVGDLRSIALAPDGTAAVVSARSGTAGLIRWAASADLPTDDDPAPGAIDPEPTPLGERPGIIGFVER